jgi:cytochrome c2
MMKWTAVAVTLLTLSGLEPTFAQMLSGPAQDPMAGSRVFGAKGCVKCHAVRNVGGKIGPDLGQIRQPRSLEDLAAAMWNHLSDMAERKRQLGIDYPSLSQQETGDLIAFLYSVNYFDPPADVAAGQRLFAEKKCVVCHQVAGTGGWSARTSIFSGDMAHRCLSRPRCGTTGPPWLRQCEPRASGVRLSRIPSLAP